MPDTSDSKCAFLSHLIRWDREVFHRGVLMFNNKRFLSGDYKFLLFQKILQHFYLKIEVTWPLDWWWEIIPAVSNDIWKDICFPDDLIKHTDFKNWFCLFFFFKVMSYIGETRLVNNINRMKSSRVVDMVSININGSKSIDFCRSSSSGIKYNILKLLHSIAINIFIFWRMDDRQISHVMQTAASINYDI